MANTYGDHTFLSLAGDDAFNSSTVPAVVIPTCVEGTLTHCDPLYCNTSFAVGNGQVTSCKSFNQVAPPPPPPPGVPPVTIWSPSVTNGALMWT